MLRHLGVVLLIVGGVAVIFWGLGEQTDDGAPVVADGPEEPDDPEDQDPGEELPEDPEDSDEPEDTAPEEQPPDDGQDPAAGEDDDGTDPGTAPTDAGDGQDGEDEPSGDPDPDEGNGEEPEDDPAPPDDAIEPATISVQVLDGYQADGGAAARAVADEIVAAGYNLIARNPALRYDVTTVLFTAGSEAAARQVAATIGASEIREQPGNLSTAVDVHIVVGADRG